MDVPKTLDCTFIEEQDLVSRYVGQKLNPEEAEAFEEHYFGCDRCWEEVQAATEVRAALAKPTALDASLPAEGHVIRGPWRASTLLAAAAAVVIGIATALVIGRDSSRRSGESAIAGLVRAVGHDYSIRARLVGGFDYPRTTRSASSNKAASWKVFAEAEKIKVAAGDNPTPEMARALGLAYLVTGEVDEAVARLKEATLRAPEDPLGHSDLAAAYLTFAEQKDRPDAIPLALSEAEVAIRLRPELPEAHFNRALALEKMSLKDQAKAEWSEYLRLDPKSLWSEEAKRRLNPPKGESVQPRWAPAQDMLQRWAQIGGSREEIRGLVARFPEQTREHFEQELLPDWADGIEKRTRQESARRLTNLRAIADEHAVLTGDRLLRDATDAAGHTFSSEDPEQLRRLVEGLTEFRLGRSLINEVRANEARPHFESARSELHLAKNPLATWADFYRAMCLYYGDQYQLSAAECERLRSLAETHGYNALRGRSLWMTGLVHLLAGEVNRALSNYTDALAAFERNHESGHVAAAHSLIAGALTYLNEPRQSWSHRLTALQALREQDDDRRAHRIYSDAAVAAVSGDLPLVGLVLQDAAVRTAGSWKSALVSMEAHLYRSFVLRRLGRSAEAATDLEEAQRWLMKINDPELSRAEYAELSAALGELDVKRSPGMAQRRLARALDYFSETRQPMRLAEIYLLRARSYVNGGDLARAESDLSAGVAELERQQGLQGSFAVSFFEKSWQFFDEIARLERRRGQRPEVLLAYVERLRARDLLARQSTARIHDSSRSQDDRPLSPDQIRSELPASTALLYFVALEDRLLSWSVTREGVRFSQQDIGSDDLIRQVSLYRTTLETDASRAETDRWGANLYDLLIRPHAAFLRSAEELVFIPDGPLNDIPFTALLDRRTARYLVQDFYVAVAPSGTVFVAASSRPPTSDSADQLEMTAFGNPARGRNAAEGLPALPHAEQEARAIAALYPKGRLFVGEEATPSRFLEAAQRGGVLHFAGHAIANSEYPEFSRLALAPEIAVPSGDLFAKQIYGRHLAVNLVVLAACRSAQGVIRRGEGSMSLARPFLAGGAAGVVGALWDVDDSTSEHIFEFFHRRLLAGRPPAQALRDAQLSCLHGDEIALRSPARWGAFTLYGSG